MVDFRLTSKESAIIGILVALGTAGGWLLSAGMHAGKLATVDRVDSVAAAQIVIDRQVSSQFAGVTEALARIETAQRLLKEQNEREHEDLKRRVERLAEASPRIVAGR